VWGNQCDSDEAHLADLCSKVSPEEPKCSGYRRAKKSQCKPKKEHEQTVEQTELNEAGRNSLLRKEQSKQAISRP
jgi:hypothetical protein